MGNPQRTVTSNVIAKGTVSILDFLRNKIPNNHKHNLLQNHPEVDDIQKVKELSSPSTMEKLSSVSGKVELKQYDVEIKDLEARLDNPSITQAKRYALKKQLAKVRSLRIREQRKQLCS